MLVTYPQQALEQLEFDKIMQYLLGYCQTDAAKEYVREIRFHTKLEFLKKALQEVAEYAMTLVSGEFIPNNFTQNIQRELKLIQLDNAVLSGQELVYIKRLSLQIKDLTLWFKRQGELYPYLRHHVRDLTYEKNIALLINEVVDDGGQVLETASLELMRITEKLGQLRQQQRKTFDGVLRKWAQQGYLADIGEAYLNGRRVAAVLSEYKRVVKGIMHGESDSQKTTFIEPEETIPINNEVSMLEREAEREIQRILKATTAQLKVYHPLLERYYYICGLFDFIRAKALLARSMDAVMPQLSQHPSFNIIRGYHPLLLLYNNAQKKPTIPVDLHLDREHRILIISGPNAGGKTVAMKTVGLLQLMLQSGLLVPVDDRTEMGIFKQIMIHIGDTQSLENELSTYSAHLRDMKHFVQFATGRTLFLIDELGSGTDPALGSAFAESIVEKLAALKVIGIITTHYLNLKIMVGKVQGIINGAMTFDEQKLEPLYRLIVGKPGSSYTFAIAQRIGMPAEIIKRAKQLTERGHVKLDRMLHQAEKQTVKLGDKEKYLAKLIDEQEKLKAHYERLISKEAHRQNLETIRLQNEIKKEELEYLRETERKFKQIIFDWKRTENKQEVIHQAEKVLFKRRQIRENENAAKKADKGYVVIGREAEIGDLVRNTQNHQIGRLESFRDKFAIIKIGNLPFTVDIKEWVAVRARTQTDKSSK